MPGFAQAESQICVIQTLTTRAGQTERRHCALLVRRKLGTLGN